MCGSWPEGRATPWRKQEGRAHGWTWVAAGEAAETSLEHSPGFCGSLFLRRDTGASYQHFSSKMSRILLSFVRDGGPEVLSQHPLGPRPVLEPRGSGERRT